MAPSVTPLSWAMGRTELRSRVTFSPALAALTSSTEESPFLVALVPVRRGKTMRRSRYSLRRWTLAFRDSSERFWRRGSTEIPMVGASLRGMPASCRRIRIYPWRPKCAEIHTFSSAREKPRPARTRRLYLIVGQRTTGRSLSVGRGATAAALAMRASRRLFFLPAYCRERD